MTWDDRNYALAQTQVVSTLEDVGSLRVNFTSSDFEEVSCCCRFRSC